MLGYATLGREPLRNARSAMSRPRSRPLVGVTTYDVSARFAVWSQPACLVPASYLEVVAAGGGLPLLLPPRPVPSGRPLGEVAGAAAEAMAALDALVIIGGGDLDPGSYRQAAHPSTDGVDQRRDSWEEAVLARALDRRIPVLAVCRGLQVLNVHLGGTLHQHLPDLVGHVAHCPAPGRFGEVAITTVAGTWAERVMGPRATVSCSHHQAVDRLGRGLVVSARAADDPVIVEAVELRDHPFAVGVQWHPEEPGDERLFAALVGACQASPTGRPATVAE